MNLKGVKLELNIKQQKILAKNTIPEFSENGKLVQVPNNVLNYD